MSQQTGFLEFDGRRIAYATVGEGPLLAMPAWWVSHVIDDWHDQAFRRLVETLARRYRVVRYDRLGTGLSDRIRPPETLTLDYEVALLEAVIDHVSAEHVTLFGLSCGAPVSAAYASRHAARVDRVVLYGGYACGSELGPPDTRAALTELVRSAWGLGSRVLADVFGRSLAADEREAFAAYQRASASAATAADLLELTYAYDVREALPTMAVPTLVVHRDHDRAIAARHGRELAGLIPGAELVTFEGDAHLPWYGDADPVLGAVARFLEIPFSEIPPLEPTAPREARAGAIDQLSKREREVLRLVAEGLGDAEIAERLVLSRHTVHRHVANIRRKLGLHSRSAAAVAASRAGLL
jgi:pimeloyl-ACP methyl ester carboxylesterase/DNA-binding CsgD family transcriptional regulator